MRATQSVGRHSGTPSSKRARPPPADSPEVSELENFEAVAAFLISHSSILSSPLLHSKAGFLSLPAVDSIPDLSSLIKIDCCHSHPSSASPNLILGFTFSLKDIVLGS